MIGTAQSAQGRSLASRGWLAIVVLGLMVLGLGVAPAFAADAQGTKIEKKKDAADKAATLSVGKSALDEIKVPEIKTAGDEPKKP